MSARTTSHSSEPILDVKLHVAASREDLRRWIKFADRYLKDFAVLNYMEREILAGRD